MVVRPDLDVYGRVERKPGLAGLVRGLLDDLAPAGVDAVFAAEKGVKRWK